MRFLEFKKMFLPFGVFSLQDIRAMVPGFQRLQLTQWLQKGYIKKIRRGYYLFSDQPLSDPDCYVLANRIYSPSYLSMELALSFYGLIPETVYGFTSVSTRKSVSFTTDFGSALKWNSSPPP